MQFYYAPMEGVTGYVFRKAQHELFPGADKYFSPFISPTQNYVFASKELKDIAPKNNEGMYLVPQILTNNADYFLWCAKELQAMGYQEINLNLGCPSGTVTAKRKGSGLLAYPEELKSFLDEIFARCPIEISVKTRLGKKAPDEFEVLLALFSRYPMKELIIHPRVQPDFYKGTVRMEWYDYALQNTALPLCYNGDIFSSADLAAFAEKHPQQEVIMVGRGAVANPALIRELRGGAPITKEELQLFHDRLYHGYREALGGGKHAIYRMREWWFYGSCLLEGYEKPLKQIRKAEYFGAYEAAVAALFRDCDLSAAPCFNPAQH